MQQQRSQPRLTRKEKRVLKNTNNKYEENPTNSRLNFNLKYIEPLTTNQKLTFESFEKDKNLLLHGIAGTGKSFISLYLSLRQILDEKDPRYKRVIIVRSVVPTRDMGFLPGSNKDKAKVYEAPYQAIFTELFGRGDAYEYLKSKNIVDFISTSFIRGITLSDSIIVVDEIANMSSHELDSIITRIGKNCRVLFCGDFRQSDFTKEQDRQGLRDFMKILHRMKSFEFIDFQKEDIVRSNLVKEYIIAKDNLNMNF
jgi:phosphate starvation-inducible protein PhoH